MAARPPPPPDVDAKTYRATACQARPADVGRYEHGAIFNPSDSATDVEVVCPLVRDNVENRDGVEIWINLAVGLEDVECEAASWSSHYQELDRASDSVSGVGFPTMYLRLETSDSGGSYSLTCTLPPDSMISSYEVQEPQGSTGNMTDYDR